MTILDRVGPYLFFLLRSFQIRLHVGSVTILAMVVLKMLPTELFGTFENEKYEKLCLLGKYYLKSHT